MSTVVTEPKDATEVIEFSLDFLSRLTAGETLQTCASAIAVISGVDADPSSMLSGAATISGTQVQQVLIGGIAGNIYKLALSARTSLNNIFVQETIVAVLPSLAVTPP